MIFAFASLVTHSLFRTDPRNMNVNKASSYLDLSPLYGDGTNTQFARWSATNIHIFVLDQAGQDKVRDRALGRGLLYPDTFYEERLMFLPPASSVLLVLFSRNHNVCPRFWCYSACQIDWFARCSISLRSSSRLMNEGFGLIPLLPMLLRGPYKMNKSSRLLGSLSQSSSIPCSHCS